MDTVEQSKKKKISAKNNNETGQNEREKNRNTVDTIQRMEQNVIKQSREEQKRIHENLNRAQENRMK